MSVVRSSRRIPLALASLLVASCASGGEDLQSINVIPEPIDSGVLPDTGTPDVDSGTGGNDSGTGGNDAGTGDAGLPDGGDPCLLNPDVPDDAFVDSNCDGIDGVAASLVFVAKSGNDTTGDGSRANPFLTIGHAIPVAQAGGLDVAIASGVYDEHVVVAAGVSLYGGYASGTWARSAANVVTVKQTQVELQAGSYVEALLVPGVHVPTIIDRLTITAGDPAIPPSVFSTSIYGVRVEGSSGGGTGGLVLRNLVVTSGRAASGQPGGTGATGEPGGTGTAGNAGLSGTPGRSAYGPGGINAACPGANGGRGGQGGNTNLCGANTAGENGQRPPADGACAVGAGGSSVSCIAYSGGDGLVGSICGAPAFTGIAGDGAPARGTVDASGLWLPGVGVVGGRGAFGAGGSGGGGGGGSEQVTNGQGGGGGGGGGAGGCGGYGGGGGGGGGGSFALFVHNSDVTVEASTFTSGNAGNGSFGGSGGPGGGLGQGGGGGMATGMGGPGGDGRPGATGGQGGGGAGGSSFGGFFCASTVTAPTATFANGTGGVGGIGTSGMPTTNGPNGASGATVSLTGSCSP